MTADVIHDLDEQAYHADRSTLSHSGAKVLADSPARFKWRLDHPEHKDSFDVGTLAHKLILGSADDRVRVADAYDWRLKKWQDWKKEQHAAGLVPVHRGDLLEASRMAWAVRRHPLASAILARPGLTEASLYGDDPATGVRLRGRCDRITDTIEGHPVIVDVKTTAMTGPASFGRKAFDYGYDTAAAWYSDLAVLAGLCDETPQFLLVVVETTAPHFVHVHEFTPDQLDRARALNRDRIELYARCVAANDWPDYGQDIHTIQTPRWVA